MIQVRKQVNSRFNNGLEEGKCFLYAFNICKGLNECNGYHEEEGEKEEGNRNNEPSN